MLDRVIGKLGTLTQSKRMVLGFVLGLFVAVGHSPVSLPAVSLVALFVIFALFGATVRARHAAWLGWAAGFGYFAASVFWIVEPFLVDVPRHGWMAPFALAFMAGGLALFWSAGFWLAARTAQKAPSRLLILILTLGLAELARSYVLTGFPWALLAYIWVETPIIQVAAYLGPHGVSAFTLLVVALPFVTKNRSFGIALSALLFVAGWGMGLYRQGLADIPPDRPVALRLIQPNAPQNQKWNPDFSDTFFRRQLGLTALPSDVPIDLTIWPEAGVTFWLEQSPDQQKQIAGAAGSNTQVILGARRFDTQGKYYNSLAVLGQTGAPQSIYDKTHLVPFGEYIPFGRFLGKLGFRGLAAEEGGGFSAGANPGLLDLGALGHVAPLICYEAIFSHIVNNSPARPDWILQITNDAWFGQIAGPQQHLAIARVRAIEQGLPLVRVANTGVSAIIDAKGRVIARIPLGVAAKLDAQLPGHLAETLYRRTGDWLVFCLLFMAFGVMRLKWFRK